MRLSAGLTSTLKNASAAFCVPPVCPAGAITKGDVVIKPNRIGRSEAKEI